MAVPQSPDPIYDAYCSVKDSPRQMALPGALIGRFIDDGTDEVAIPALSRRQRAAQRTIT